MLKRALITTLALAGLSLTTLGANAEQYAQTGDYQIHYSAVSTRFLTPDVIQAYNLQRSANLGLVNVSVREKQEDGSTTPVNANVKGSVGDLAGSRESLSFRTVHEDDAIYHLATFTLRDDESMRFELDVQYDRNAEPEPVNFTQRFYIER